MKDSFKAIGKDIKSVFKSKPKSQEEEAKIQSEKDKKQAENDKRIQSMKDSSVKAKEKMKEVSSKMAFKIKNFFD